MEQPLQRADLLRRLENLIRLGTVAEVDYPNARVRVTVSELRTDWLPWLTRRAGGDRDWWAPEVDEQVLVLAISADPAQSVVLPAVYQDAFPPPETDPDIRRILVADGADMSYNRSGHLLQICLPDGGWIRLCVDKVVVENGDVIVNNGSVFVNNGSVLVDNGDVIADGISLKTHVHTGVKSGSELSGPPAGGG